MAKISVKKLPKQAEAEANPCDVQVAAALKAERARLKKLAAGWKKTKPASAEAAMFSSWSWGDYERVSQGRPDK
ncbi:MAG: hypothetical protein WAM82_21005 [Thermoanaerobaculia bacterium]